MLAVFHLLTHPATAWQNIADKKRGVAGVLTLFFVPLAAVSLGIEYYGLQRWGTTLGAFGTPTPVPAALALKYALVQFGMSLIIAFLGAKLIQWISESFHFYPPYEACFRLAAYGFSPLFLGRIADALPGMHTWLCWAIGAALCISILYHGTGIALQPDQTKGFGLYMLSSMVLVITSGLAHFTAIAVLQGELLRSPP